MVIAKFIAVDTGLTYEIASGSDWMQALDRLYSKVMHHQSRPVLHIKFEFK